MDEFISREETIKRIKEVYCAGCNSYNGVRCRACGTGDAIDIIDDFPAADVDHGVNLKALCVENFQILSHIEARRIIAPTAAQKWTNL